ncbi:MAG: NUDIX domain-containing protein [Myxococcales bacterium]|nr:NUDIX domain-containing protein [Myxococcales bacterium]
MNPIRDKFCSACGTAYAPPLAYPRLCANPACRMMVWANPIPVAVTLVPVVHGARTGLLVVRRGIEPRRGLLALVGGFVEDHERWQTAAAREVREEVHVEIDADSVTLRDAVSTEPRPNRILLFATCARVDAATFPPFAANTESMSRGVIFGPDGLDDAFAFPLHAAAARRWFAERGATGSLDHLEL